MLLRSIVIKGLSIAAIGLGFIACSSNPIARSVALDVEDAVPAPLTAQIKAIASGQESSEAAVQAALTRIDQLDRNGPKINSIISINPDALTIARLLDNKQKTGGALGVLHGAPIVLKDNIESLDPLPTTAGSLVLKGNLTRRDSTVMMKLRAAGAVMVAKSNLSEWANMRSNKSTSGWSAVGGLTRNPHVLDHNACGSSSGSGAAVAAGLVFAAIGTETDGSITCPASINGVVGFKPTVGMVSRTQIVPISHSQDTAGPMTQSVRDAALLMDVLVGSDPNDPVTLQARLYPTRFVQALDVNALRGLRIGFVQMTGVDQALIAKARARLELAGAVIVDVPIDTKEFSALGEAEFKVLLSEFKVDLQRYLESTDPTQVRARTLRDVIDFNQANASLELQHFGQETLEQAQKQKGVDDPEYLKALMDAKRLATLEGLDKLFASYQIHLLVGQSNSPAWPSTLGKGDAFKLPSLSRLPAVAGYPHLTVPMGAVGILPVGLSFIGPKWTDAQVLAAGYAFEQAGVSLRVQPKFLQRLEP